MSSIIVKGGYPITGEIKVQGSKNAALPVLAASILIHGVTVIKHCPKITDVFCMIEILKQLGCQIEWKENTVLVVDASNITNRKLPTEEAKKMRSSITLLGALLGREKEAFIPYPGGCLIGKRPIDIHLTALRSLGIEIQEKEEGIYGKIYQKPSGRVKFSYPSVGATQNAILASIYSDSQIILENCAIEPEVEELCLFLKKAGARIEGIGCREICIKGVSGLKEITYEIRGDRIVADSYLAAAAITRGQVTVEGIFPQELAATIVEYRKMGASIKVYKDAITLDAVQRKRLCPLQIITKPYPGFPTDMQSLFMSLLSIANGKSEMKEEIFEDRFQTAFELIRMGAKIEIEKEKKTAIIQGVSRLYPAQVTAFDLRGGAALIIAALSIEGESTIKNAFYVERGYEDIDNVLTSLGGNIQLIR